MYDSGEYTNIMVKVCNKAGKCTKYKEFSTNKEKTFLLTMLIEIFEKAEQDEF